jgi:hypothetical protein
MEDTGNLQPGEMQAALILSETGQIGVSLPKQEDEEVVPRHVVFIAAVASLLISDDPVFTELYRNRAETIIQRAESEGVDAGIPSGDVREMRALDEGDLGDWDMTPRDAAIVLSADWTIHLYVPAIEEADDEDPVPDHSATAVVLAALINTDPEFVEKVWELWERRYREEEE